MGSTRLEIKFGSCCFESRNRTAGCGGPGGADAAERVDAGSGSDLELDAACCGIRGVDMVMAWSFEELARSEIDIARGAAAGGRSSA